MTNSTMPPLPDLPKTVAHIDCWVVKGHLINHSLEQIEDLPHGNHAVVLRSDVEAYAAPLVARVAELEALSERLKMEAQIHAQEARTANATIAEIYQCVTGKTGEPGNWNGAEPVRARLVELEEALENCVAFIEDAHIIEAQWTWEPVKQARAAIAARKEQP